MEPFPPDLRQALERGGLLRRGPEGARPGPEALLQERWRYRHLAAMALLARRADPGWRPDAVTAERLYAGLAALLPLRGSAVRDIEELLQEVSLAESVEEASDPFNPAPRSAQPPRPPEELGEADLDAYADALRATIRRAAAESPWRVGEDKRRSEPDFLPGAGPPPDLFRGSRPGVIPPMDGGEE